VNAPRNSGSDVTCRKLKFRPTGLLQEQKEEKERKELSQSGYSPRPPTWSDWNGVLHTGSRPGGRPIVVSFELLTGPGGEAHVASVDVVTLEPTPEGHWWTHSHRGRKSQGQTPTRRLLTAGNCSALCAPSLSPSVSVRLSHAGIVSKRLDISSSFLNKYPIFPSVYLADRTT